MSLKMVYLWEVVILGGPEEANSPSLYMIGIYIYAIFIHLRFCLDMLYQKHSDYNSMCRQGWNLARCFLRA